MADELRAVICGGSGLIGTAVAEVLRQGGYSITVLTRGPDAERDGLRFVHWDGKTVGGWGQVVDGAAVAINLAGRSIDCVPSSGNRRDILASRIDSVRALGEAVAGASAPPKVVVQASAVGYYGDTDEECDESRCAGSGFLAETCVAWEDAFDSVDLTGVRKIKLRIGIVLSRSGGALARLRTLTRLFLGGRVGSGKQWISWIHMADLARMFLFAVEGPVPAGVLNAVAPNPVTNAEFMAALRRACRRPWSPPVPSIAVRLGAPIMGTNADLALAGQRCVPAKFLERGFEYEFEKLGDALADLV